MAELTGKVAIVTGAAQGQGAAIAGLLAEKGATVVLTDLAEKGSETAAQIGERAMFVRHDVASEVDWTSVVDATMQRFGRIDILVNNAGVYRVGTLAETSADMMNQVYQVNSLGVMLGMRAVMDAMIAAGQGVIINIASGAALRGSPGMFAYSASKWAVRGMTRGASLELAPHKIRVNGIFPGPIDTPMLSVNPPEMLANLPSMIPLGRLGTIDDTAALVAFLVSDAATFITGAEIALDGGITA